jgi:DNA gyrase subunit B
MILTMGEQGIEEISMSEHIRKRPAMYIGGLNIAGFNYMLETFFEELLKDCYKDPIFEIEIYPFNRFELKLININPTKLFSRIKHLNSKDSLGLAVLITLNSNISISTAESTSLILHGKNGNNKIVVPASVPEKINFIIDYSLDTETFKEFSLSYEQINIFLRQFAFLNPALKIISIDRMTDELQRNIFCYPTGIFKQLDLIVSKQLYGKPMLRLDIEKKTDKFFYQIGICYAYLYADNSFVKSYAGNIETYLGGSLPDGIIAGLIQAIKYTARKKKFAITISKKLVLEDLNLIAAVKGEDLVFYGSTKRQLGMPKLRNEVKKIVFEEMTAYFESNPIVKENVLAKFGKWN